MSTSVRHIAYQRIASAIHRRIQDGDRNLGHLSIALFALSPSIRHRAAASDLRRALSRYELDRALEIATTVKRVPNPSAEKIVSRKYHYVYICNPKVASRSLIAALRHLDPDAELVRHATIDEVYASNPEAQDYSSFAFVRNPYHRAYSFFAEKHLAKSERKQRLFVEPYYGITKDLKFDSLCEWLNTPYGSDEFADIHWLSQHRNIAMPDGRMPDFIGRFENLYRDLDTIAEALDMPTTNLPHLNRATGSDSTDAAGRERYRRQRDEALNLRNKALLRQRYADDFKLGNYAH